MERHARCGRLHGADPDRALDHRLPDGLGRQFPTQDGQACRPAFQPEEDHRSGAGRDHGPDPALPAGAALHQCARGWGHRGGLCRTGAGQRDGVGRGGGGAEPRALPRGHRAGRRRGVGGVHAVRQRPHGAGAGGRIDGHSPDFRQPAHAVADQPRQPNSPRGDFCRRAGLGLAVGAVGPAAGRALADGHQGGVRPRGRLQGGG